MAAYAQEAVSPKPDSTATVSTQAPVPVVAPTRIPPGAKIYIEPSDFGMALAAAILKKNVPVVSMTDSAKSDFFVHTASNERIEKGGERIAKALVFGGWMGSGRHFSAAVTISNRDGAIVFAKNSKKENFQSAAENVANSLKYHVGKAPKESKQAEVADAR
jgi:hypothetical protein